MIGNRAIFHSGLAAFCTLILILHTSQARGEPITLSPLPIVGAAGDQYGRRVDVSLETAIIGGRFGGSSGEGTAQILSGGWAVQQTLTTSDPSLGTGDQFGVGVGIDQDLAAVGASGNKTVYVYRRVGTTGPWNPEGSPWFSMPGVDNFGIDVRVSGGRIIVGSTDNAAYVYTELGGVWTGSALPASGAKSQFGSSVGIYGANAIVGDWGANTAYLYSYGGSSWIEDAAFSMSSGSFGESVSVFGDYAIVGAPAANSGTGLVKIYHRNAGIWSLQATLTASHGMIGDGFGSSVDIGEDYAIIGASGGVDANGTISGAAYVFRRDGSTWIEEDRKLVPTGDEWFIEFGSAVALDEGAEVATVIVGAWGYDSDTGSAYAHTIPEPHSLLLLVLGAVCIGLRRLRIC